MNTVVLEVRSLRETLADAARAMKTGSAEREARISFATPGASLGSTDREALGTSEGPLQRRTRIH
jgi:hypothetical protein